LHCGPWELSTYILKEHEQCGKNCRKITKSTPNYTIINEHAHLSKQALKCYVRKISPYALKQNSWTKNATIKIVRTARVIRQAAPSILNIVGYDILIATQCLDMEPESYKRL
jgi:hypothetical protein